MTCALLTQLDSVPVVSPTSVFSNEIADETRSLGEDEPPRQRNAAGFWYTARPVKGFGTVLVQSSQKRGIGVAAKLESALESIVHFMSGRSAAW